MTVTEGLVDAKDEARQAEIRAEIVDSHTSLMIAIVEGQRTSDRVVFRVGMWMIAMVFTASAAVVGIMIALQS